MPASTTPPAHVRHRRHRGDPRRGPRPLRRGRPPGRRRHLLHRQQPGGRPELYSALERAELPEAAVLASLGCGNPIAVAELHEGERVLDLGSGGGIDVLLSAPAASAPPVAPSAST